jgi:hypothetical protein
MSEIKVNSIKGVGASAAAITVNNTDGTCTANLRTRSNKNLLINGEALVHQRGDASVAVGDGNYLVDRFRFANNGTLTGTGAQDSTVPDIANSSYFAKSMKVTSTGTTAASSAGDYAAITTRLERNDVANLGWGTSNAQTVTLSFYVRSSKTGIFSAYLIGGDGFNRTFTFEYTIASANTWQKIEKTITGDTGGTWTYSSANTIGLGVSFVLENLGSGAGTTSTLNSWAAGNNYAGSSNQVNLFDTNGATFYITGIQLEVGSVATDFEHRSFGQELALCQRYYFQLVDDNTQFIGIGHSFSSSEIDVGIPFQTAMRAAPSLVQTSGGNYFGVLGGGDSTAYVDGNWTIFAPTEYGCFLYATPDATITAGNTKLIRSTNASARLAFNAEL